MFYLVWIVVKRLGLNSSAAAIFLAGMIAITVGLFVQACGADDGQKTVSLRDGRNVTVYYEPEQGDAGENILIVEFRNDIKIVREATAERDVFDIWMGLSSEAGRFEAEEALIKYRYPTGDKNKEGKEIYDLLLFTADRTETGSWTIRRVN